MVSQILKHEHIESGHTVIFIEKDEVKSEPNKIMLKATITDSIEQLPIFEKEYIERETLIKEEETLIFNENSEVIRSSLNIHEAVALMSHTELTDMKIVLDVTIFFITFYKFNVFSFFSIRSQKKIVVQTNYLWTK